MVNIYFRRLQVTLICLQNYEAAAETRNMPYNAKETALGGQRRITKTETSLRNVITKIIANSSCPDATWRCRAVQQFRSVPPD